MRRLTSTLWLSLLLGVFAPSPSHAQTSTQVPTEPAVIAAVAPVFGPIARSAHVRGDVVVEVTINARGEVDDTKIISGHALLQASSKAAAKKWRFAVDDRHKRTCRLTFTFGYVDGRKNDPEYTTTFMPPYRVEILWNPPAPGY